MGAPNLGNLNLLNVILPFGPAAQSGITAYYPSIGTALPRMSGGSVGPIVGNYQTVQTDFVGLPGQPILNFVPPLIGSNDAGNTSTDVTIWTEQIVSGAGYTVTSALTNVFSGFKALTGNVNVLLPASPFPNQMVYVADLDGSLANHNVTIEGNGNNIDNASANIVASNTLGGPKAVFGFFFLTAYGWKQV
jgi:hypothetical protein